jgi:hypothetical protein
LVKGLKAEGFFSRPKLMNLQNDLMISIGSKSPAKVDGGDYES